jgi:hypothetical protein
MYYLAYHSRSQVHTSRHMCHKVRLLCCESRTYLGRSNTVCISLLHPHTFCKARCTSCTRLSSYRYKIYCCLCRFMVRRGMGFGECIYQCSCPALDRETWDHRRGRNLDLVSMIGSVHYISLYRKNCKHAESGFLKGSFNRKSCISHLPSGIPQRTLDNFCLLNYGKFHKNGYIIRSEDLTSQKRIQLYKNQHIYHPKKVDT